MSPTKPRLLLPSALGLLLLAGGPRAHATVETYPPPRGIAPSEHYTVKVSHGGRVRDSFVYMVRAQRPKSNRSRTTSWTTFSFSGEVTVHVTKLGGAFTRCKVIPTSYRIRPAITGNTVSFELDRPRKVSVEFDGDITHPLLVFADPLETNVPAPDAPDVVYFAPGVHDIGKGYAIGPGKTVYLAGGAYVKGQLVTKDASGVTIRGRGILSGEEFAEREVHLIDITGWKTRGTLIEGITLVDSPHYNIRMAGRRNTVRNVKVISWYFSTDGVSTGPGGLVEDCFFKVNDDAVKLYWSNMTVRRCVIWQLENGAPFQISWNMPSDNSGFRVTDCDVIRAEHRWDNANLAIFGSIHGGPGHMSDYLFEDIRVENAHWCLVRLTMEKTRFSAHHKGWGRISGLTFRNITVDGPMKKPNVIRGHDRDHRISDVAFENVSVDGRYITSSEDGNFQIDPDSTSGISFKVTKAGGR